MSLRYEWGFDAQNLTLDGDAISSLSVHVDDATDSGVAELTSTYCHTWLDPILTEYDSLEFALEAEVETVLTTYAWDAMTWDGSQYVLTYDNTGTFPVTLDFTSATLGDNSGKMLAAILGFDYTHADASGGSASDPYNITLSGAASYTSNVRPYFLVRPVIGARSQMTEDYEGDSGVQSAEADDGTTYEVAKDGVAVFNDWQQMAEQNAPGTAYAAAGDGTPVHKRFATAAVPWTYQHAWEHSRTGGAHPFLVVDSGTGESAVHKLRADGAGFRPARFASQDFDLWTIPFRTILLGRL